MANNKVQLADGTVLLDLSGDTVTSSDHIIQGRIGHLANGSQVVGTVTFVTYYTGTTNPSSSMGSNGDIYLKVVN